MRYYIYTKSMRKKRRLNKLMQKLVEIEPKQLVTMNYFVQIYNKIAYYQLFNHYILYYLETFVLYGLKYT